MFTDRSHASPDFLLLKSMLQGRYIAILATVHRLADAEEVEKIADHLDQLQENLDQANTLVSRYRAMQIVG